MSHLVQSAVVRHNDEELNRNLLTIPRGLAVAVVPPRRKRGLVNSEIDGGGDEKSGVHKRRRFFGCTMSPLMRFTSNQAITVAGVAEVCFHFGEADPPMQTKCFGAPVYVCKTGPSGDLDPNRGRFTFERPEGALPAGFFVQPTSKKTGNIFVQGNASARATKARKSAYIDAASIGAMKVATGDTDEIKIIMDTWHLRNLRDRISLMDTTRRAFKAAVAGNPNLGALETHLDSPVPQTATNVKAFYATAIKLVEEARRASPIVVVRDEGGEKMDEGEEDEAKSLLGVKLGKEWASMQMSKTLPREPKAYAQQMGKLFLMAVEALLLNKAMGDTVWANATPSEESIDEFVAEHGATEESRRKFRAMLEMISESGDKKLPKSVLQEAVELVPPSSQGQTFGRQDFSSKFGGVAAAVSDQMATGALGAGTAAGTAAGALTLTPTEFGGGMTAEEREEAVGLWNGLVKTPPSIKHGLAERMDAILGTVLTHTASAVNDVFPQEEKTKVQVDVIDVFTQNAVTRVLTERIAAIDKFQVFGAAGAYLAADVIAVKYKTTKERMNRMVERGKTQAKQGKAPDDASVAEAMETFTRCREELAGFYGARMVESGEFQRALEREGLQHAGMIAQLGGLVEAGRRVPREVVDWHRTKVVSAPEGECATFAGLDNVHVQRLLLVEYWLDNWASLPPAARPPAVAASAKSTLNVATE